MQGRYDHYERVSCLTEITDEKDGWYRFADTVFYGEKGGMPDDRGTINGLNVDGLYWEGEELWHHVNGILHNIDNNLLPSDRIQHHQREVC